MGLSAWERRRRTRAIFRRIYEATGNEIHRPKQSKIAVLFGDVFAKFSKKVLFLEGYPDGIVKILWIFSKDGADS